MKLEDSFSPNEETGSNACEADLVHLIKEYDQVGLFQDMLISYCSAISYLWS